MGEGIVHIMSPLSAPWTGWTMFLLFLAAILSEWLQPGVITQSPLSLAVRAERTYKDAPTNLIAQMLIHLFRMGTIAMLLCLSFSEEGRFSFLAFLAVCGIIIGVFIVKLLCSFLIDYTFQLSRTYGDLYEHYSNLFTLTTTVLYPVLLVFLHVDSQEATRWLLVGVIGVFLILWLVRSVQQYVRSIMAVLYVIVYTMTLELLPMAGLVYLSAKTISIL